MSGVSYADLINYNGEMETSAKGWATLLAGVEESASYFQKNAIAPTGQIWVGTAQQLASQQFIKTHGGLIANGSKLTSIRSSLNQFDMDMQSFQSQLKTLVKQIEDGTVPGASSYPPGYFSVSQDGIVSLVHQFPDTVKPAEIEAFVKIGTQLQGMVNNIVAQADQGDCAAAKALSQYFPQAEFHQQTPVTQTWTTASGYGSLWQIAQSEYGNPDLWMKIWESPANAATFRKYGVTDPSNIPINMPVKVPPLVASTGPAKIRQPAPQLTPAQINQLWAANGGLPPPGVATTPGHTDHRNPVPFE